MIKPDEIANEKQIYLLAEKVLKLMQARQLKLVTVESCTGGMIAAAITAVPGSSAVFERGFVTYSNEAKMELVGVSAQTLAQHGAVSAKTVREMVEGGLRASNKRAQVGIAVTGVAGPDGGSEQKPVGTVCVAWKILTIPTIVKQFCFTGDRKAVRLQTTSFALAELSDFLSNFSL